MSGTFVPLPPPPDGLSSAIGEGRRRRRRRVAATSTAAVTALVGVLALTVLTSTGGTDALEPLPPAVTEPDPTASPSEPAPPPSPTSTTAGSPQLAASGPAATRSPSPAAAAPAATTAPSPAPQPEPGGYRTPDLVRTYVGPPAQARLCGAAYSNDSSTGQVGWCVAAGAERTAEGADLVVEVCRDGATAGLLTFGTDHEVDLAVLEDGRTLWQWTVGRTAADDEHVLSGEPGGCWTWRAPWTGVDQDGEELEAGTYLLRVRSLADELTEVDPQDTSFTL